MNRRRRLAAVATLVVAALLAAAAPAAAEAPWLQVTTSSRPTNLWTPANEVQEVKKQPALTLISLDGSLVACMGGSECTSAHSLPNAETAAELQESLEVAYGVGAVAVSEDPQSAGRFLVESVGPLAGRYVSPLQVVSSESSGDHGRVLVNGGSGRLAVSVTNLGDAAVEASPTPLKIHDELPEGVSAYHVTASAGNIDLYGPVECAVESPSQVECSFEGTLPTFEAIELEIYVSLTSEPPAAGQPGTVSVTGANAAPVTQAQPIQVSSQPTPFGVERLAVSAEEEGGATAAFAGTHPFQLTTTLQLNQGAMIPGTRLEQQPAQPRNLRFTLPAGLVGNASSIPQCDALAFAPQGLVNECPPEAAIGVASVTIVNGTTGSLHLAVPVFNLQPLPGEPARFGFVAAAVPVTLHPTVKTSQGYRIMVSSDNVSETAALIATTVSLWGDPADARHDASRGWNCVYYEPSGPCLPPTELTEPPFLRLPTSCAGPLEFAAEMEPWNQPSGSGITGSAFSSAALTGCDQVPFAPSIDVQADADRAEAPTGLHVALRVPQPEASEEPSTADVRNTKVRLPAGLQINPAGANGLTACSEAEAGFQRLQPSGEAVFDEAPAQCPESSKLGTVKVVSPLIKEPLVGSVYQAAQGDGNPFGSLLALYVVAEAPGAGVRVKLAGKVEPTPDGLVSTFVETPQVPFEEFDLSFFGGSGAPLATGRCGAYETEAEIVPWSGNPAARPTSRFDINRSQGGGACVDPPPFSPSFSAGTEAPVAGAYSPFLLHLSRDDGSQQLGSVETTLPPGLTAKLAGVPFCPESAVKRAQSLDKPGDGAVEIREPSCPAGSQVGVVDVASGVGPNPYLVHGKVYLAGPYKGAPISMLIVTPAVAGPFDLGAVAVRVALHVDPVTAQATAKSDPLPSQLEGIPLDVRTVSLKLNRPSFTLNPTSCEPTQVTGSAVSLLGQPAGLSSRFQVGECKSLGFKPRFSLRLKGGTRRGAYPALTAVVRPRQGDANIGRANVTLPHSAFLAQEHIGTVCTRVQFAANSCPKGSVYGYAIARTPLLDEPLEGPVYLRSSDHPLPDLVADLHGLFDIQLVGRIDSVHARIRTRFEAVPDQPVSSFTLKMKGGKKGLIVNSVNLCTHHSRAKARLTAQNGRALTLEPLVKAPGCRGKKKHHR